MALPQNISKAALYAVAKNSVRHLGEADEHFKHQRYPSALSSGVMSIEETGKLISLRIGGMNQRSHERKQIFFVLLLKSLENFPWLMQWQRIIKDGPDADLTLSGPLQEIVANNPEFRELVDRLQAGELRNQQERVSAFAAALLAKEQRDGTYDRWLPLFEGRLHRQRMQATYVDVGDSGEVCSDPSSILPQDAERICSFAVLFVFVTLGILFTPDENAELTKSLAPDLTGTQVLEKFAELLSVLVSAWQNAKRDTQPN